MIYKCRYCFLMLLVGSILMVSCSEDKKPVTTAVVPVKPVVMAPFRFHKLIEVSPGEDYDVLSWGRGSTKTGAFEILHSDSSAAKFTTTTGDLDGDIVDAYNSDMDLDGNPEILIRAKGKDTINYTNIYAFEFNNSGAHKLDFPKLTRSQRAGYRGDDNFYIKDGKLIREFPIYDGNTKAAKATGAKRQFEYGLRNNEFTIKQLSKDSTDVKTVQKEQAKVSTSGNKETTSKKSKKHKEETHKKKRRRHRSND
ncbi:hypothetical protein [Mucilaginibacter xinganensis]|uniref:Uncharacterized protein n=1 Tax=Mucilaginibacter xinganensis TaxID=1234841 RepID=A0A223NY04_9SPHI|nr:hypothetical protein [Mucilaginibacter xinganensis]ASU34478.1 hypothetical protein MuYL_2591 [Mucilaginibacter xinganensis]